MAKKEETEQEPLTEEQRIAALEGRVGTNKIVLLVMALFLIIVISVSVTTFALVASSDGDEEVVEVATVTELQQQVSSLQAQLETQSQYVNKVKSQFLVIQDQLESSSNLKLLKIITEQETAHQEFLDALRSGMYDLAHMLPGSRTWLEVYGEKVDLAEAHSKAREKDLKQLSSQSTSQDSDEDLW